MDENLEMDDSNRNAREAFVAENNNTPNNYSRQIEKELSKIAPYMAPQSHYAKINQKKTSMEG